MSGWGFELTCRVPAATDNFKDDWVSNWMQRIAEYLAASGAVLEPFHHKGMTQTLSDNEEFADWCSPLIRFSVRHAETGAFSFLQMVGLTRNELDALRSWDARQFVELVQERNPLLLTDARRPSISGDPGVRACGRETGNQRGFLLASSPACTLWFQEAAGATGPPPRGRGCEAQARFVNESTSSRATHPVLR